MKINFIQNIKNINYMPLRTKSFAPRLNVLKNDVFEKTNEPTFTGHPCGTDGFRVKYLFDMPCSCCGQNMVTNSQLASFIENVNDKKGEDLVKVLERYKDYYRPIEKEAVQEIEKYSVIRPDANIAELTREISILHRQKLVNEQTLVIDELKLMSHLINKSRREAYEQFLDIAQKNAKEFDDEHFFKRKTFIATLDNICEGATTAKNLEKIRSVAHKMPNSLNSASAFFIKYARRGQEEIASRLLRTSLATVEHVIPRSRGGENNTDNYISMCSNCNSARGDIPYGSWFNIHPEMPENLQKYLDEVMKRLKTGQLKGYEKYPYEIAETINMESGGKTKVKVNEFVPVDDTFEDIPKECTKEERIAAIQKKLDKRKAELGNLYKIREELSNDKEYKMLIAYFELLDEFDLADKKMQIAFKRLTGAKQSQALQERRKKEAERIEEELQSSKLSPREERKLEESLKKVRERIQKHIEVDEEREEAEAEYKEAEAKYNRKKLELAKLKERVKPPEHYTEIEKELSDELAKIYSTREEISSLRVKISEKDAVQSKKTEIQAQIKQLQYSLGLYGNINDYTGRDDVNMLQKYEMLITKRDFLDSLKSTDVKSSKKFPRGLKPDFIIKEARKSVRTQLDEICQEPVVKSKIIQEKIEELQSQKDVYNEKLQKISETEKRIEELELLIEKYENKGVEKSLIDRLEEVRRNKKANKERIETKIGYISIDRQISALEEVVDKYVEEIKRIKKLKK